MSIKTAIDKLTGKSSKNIEDAISKIDLGGSGGDNYLIATITGSAGNYTSTHSYSELIEALAAGKQVYIKTSWPYFATLAVAHVDESGHFVTNADPGDNLTFGRTYIEDGSVFFIWVCYTPDGNVYCSLES